MVLIEGKGLTLGYEGQAVIEELSFRVESGDYLAIVGENGAGKSTLAKSVLGLVDPLAGKIEYPGLRHSEIGYLPQISDIQRDFPSSVMEVVLSGALGRERAIFGYPKKEKERALSILARLGMGERASSSFQNLSGGQQQRVLLARALMATEKLLFLDEPAASLDTEATSELYAILSELNETGIAIMMITHDIHPVLQSARTILHLSHTGCFFGPKEEYFLSADGKRFMKESGHDC